MANPDYQALGSESPELHAATEDRKGWAGDPAISLGAEQISHHQSFWNDRANMHDLGAGTHASYAADFFEPGRDGADTDIPTMAGHVETPAAGLQVTPYAGYSGDGIIPADDAAAEQSGNAGIAGNAMSGANPFAGMAPSDRLPDVG
ncbi:MAG TPA: hypothetical protein VKX16_10305 [Chloroflexota bacterium]|nr:hypothetical protein [Chloroflexota bacterium]